MLSLFHWIAVIVSAAKSISLASFVHNGFSPSNNTSSFTQLER